MTSSLEGMESFPCYDSTLFTFSLQVIFELGTDPKRAWSAMTTVSEIKYLGVLERTVVEGILEFTRNFCHGVWSPSVQFKSFFQIPIQPRT